MNAALQRFLKIVFGSTILSCLLGISLDLITANVAVEYFSVHHPRVIPTNSPWLLALFWGVAASWWFGAISGVIVGFTNHRRPEPLAPGRILKWTATACVVLWIIMILVVVSVMALSSTIPIERRPSSFESDRRLVAVALAHQYEYALGAIALLIIAVKTWRSPQTPRPREREGPA